MTLTIDALTIYPVKSLGGIPLATARIERRGMQYDRRWLVVDDSDRFITQRECPFMATIAVGVTSDFLTLSVPGMPVLQVPIDVQGSERRVRIWRDTVPARDAGEEAAQWLSVVLGRSCRLVQMPETTRRPVNPAYGQPGDIVSFADGYPYILIGQGSLDDLNARLSAPVSMRRFRPNFVVAGSQPFAEDAWQRVRIGAITFRVAKSCARCIIPTIDPDQGTFAGKEPLRTLATYRKVGSKVLFGRYLIAEQEGDVHIGDLVEPLA